LAAAQIAEIVASRGAPVAPAQVSNPGSSEQSSLAEPAARTAKVAILVYHHINQFAPLGSRNLRRLTVTTEILDQQMKYLQDNDYHVVTFSDLADYLSHGGELPSRPIIISFDDGWQNQFVHALPVLEKYHYRATFFIVTDKVGQRGFFSWPQLRSMLSEGMRIGSHSLSHPNLLKVRDANQLRDQIYRSKEILESQLNTKIDEFAYPYGAYDSTIAELVREAGYKAARACCHGPAKLQTDVYKLRALMVPNDLTAFQKYLGARPPLETPAVTAASTHP
jgi:peptidoglycan/xylan/chitin deacetylase (PgdA/CDA1 family)